MKIHKRFKFPQIHYLLGADALCIADYLPGTDLYTIDSMEVTFA